MPKVQAPFGVSLLHLVLIIQGYNQNYMKDIYKLNNIYFKNTFWKHLFILYFAYNFLLSLEMYNFEVFSILIKDDIN